MKIINCENQKQWDDYVAHRDEANFLQSWDFYEFHLARGKKVVRHLIVDDNQTLLGAWAGVVETARRGRHLAIAGGPLLDWENHALVDFCFRDIKKSATAHRCTFARVRPQLPLTNHSLAIMKETGLKRAPIYLSVEYAGILDLAKSEEEILKNASQGLRRKIRKAEKARITIEKSEDPAIIKTFYQIQLQTARRQKFIAFSEDFFTKQFAAFAKDHAVTMYTAKLGDEILAQNFIIFYGAEASYHYGVSSDLGTKYSAAPLLHLAAMRDARSRHITRYNFWGIVDPTDTHHRFYGVSEFKRSFGVTELKYTPAHDLIINRPAYLKTYLIETIRKKIRHV